jgi:alpha-glucosidase
MHDAAFLLRRGVDGFRVDAISHIVGRRRLPRQSGQSELDRRRPDIIVCPDLFLGPIRIHDVIAEMRRVVDEFDDRLLIGEIYLPIERLVAYYGKELQGVHLPFNFQLLDARWNAAEIGRLIEKYEAALPQGAWPNWVLSNHDRPRIAARVGSAQARIA